MAQDDYELLKKLKSGGMAEVFLARRRGARGFEKQVVLKRLLPHLTSDPVLTSMFLDEARLAARLSHPNIVQIFDLGERDGEFFFVMEHVAGRDLGDRIDELIMRDVRMPPEHAVRLVCTICDALDYAHEARGDDGQPLELVHRDVTPSNVLLTDEGSPKLIDFGIARGLHRAEKTSPGVILGKVGYMSPEQAEGAPVDRRTDIFSTGVVLYELLTNQQPFHAQTLSEQLRLLASEERPDPRGVVPDLPDDLVAILRRAYARDPDERYQRAADMQMDLERWLSSHGLVSSPRMLASWLADALPAPTTVSAARFPDSDTAVTAEAPGHSSAPTQEALPPPSADVDVDVDVEPTLLVSRYGDDVHSAETAVRPAPKRRTPPAFFLAGALAVVAVAAGIAFALRPADEPAPIWAALPDEPAPTEAPAATPPAGASAKAPAPNDSPPPAEPPAPEEQAPSVEEAPSAQKPEPAPKRRRAGRRRRAEAKTNGRLILDAEPWARVSLGGKRLGITPLDVEVPTGRQRLILENPELGIKRTVIVTIQDGRPTRKRVQLQAGP